MAARAAFRAGAFATVTGIELADFDFLFYAKGSFLERDLHVVAKIGTAVPIFAAATPAAAKKRFKYSAAAAKDFTKDIEGIMKPATGSGALGKGSVAKAIVGRALIGIHQDVVSLAEFLEFLLGVRVVRVFVRMKFDRELAIGALDLLLGGRPLNGEHS